MCGCIAVSAACLYFSSATRGAHGENNTRSMFGFNREELTFAQQKVFFSYLWPNLLQF